MRQGRQQVAQTRLTRAPGEERRRREIEPTLSMLRNALLEEPASEDDRVALERDEKFNTRISGYIDLGVLGPAGKFLA